MQSKYYLELSEAQAIHLRTAVRNELRDIKQSLHELRKELYHAETFKRDSEQIAMIKSDIEELRHMIKKLEQVKAQLYDIL